MNIIGFKKIALLIGTLTIISYILVKPIGEYAIDDDWAYVKSLSHLHFEGRLKILDWNPMSLIGHLFWGILFTKLFGFSFTVTKISVVGVLLIECLTLAAFLRRFQVSLSCGLMAILTIFFNPLHFYHSFLYDTDIPAIAWQLLSLFFYLRALEKQKRGQSRDLILGSIFGSLAFLVRQNGLLVVAAFFIYLLLWGREKLTSFRILISSFSLPLATFVIFQYWYNTVHGPTEAFVKSSQALLNSILSPSLELIAAYSFFLMMYLGFFLVPLTLSSRLDHLLKNPRKWVALYFSICLFAIVMCLLMAIGPNLSFPYLPNKLTPFGFMSPNEVVVGNRAVLWTGPVSWVITFSPSCHLSPFFSCVAILVRIAKQNLFGSPLSICFRFFFSSKLYIP
jgi:hypothetical protein